MDGSRCLHPQEDLSIISEGAPRDPFTPQAWRCKPAKNNTYRAEPTTKPRETIQIADFRTIPACIIPVS